MLLQDLKRLPAQVSDGLKVKIEAGSSSFGKAIISENKKLVSLFTKSLGVATGIAAGIGLLAKGSPKLATALGRLEKIFLLFFKPFGDFVAKFVTGFAMWLRELQKQRTSAITALGPEKTALGEAAGAGIGAGLGGAAGLIGAGALTGSIGGPVGALAGAGIVGLGLIGGAALGYFFGPQGLKGLEDALAGTQAAIGAFVEQVKELTKPIWEPVIQAAQSAWNFVYGNFIQPIVSELGELLGVFGQVFSDIYTSVSTWIGNAWTAISSEFIQPILGGLADLASAVLETATAWASYIYDEFIEPVLKQFREWYEELTEKVIKPIVEWMTENVIKPLQDAWSNFAETVKGYWEGIKATIQSIYNTVKPMIDFIRGGVSAAGQAIGGALSGAATAVRAAKPQGYQVGGLIGETGLYWMHRGEFVQPASTRNASRVFNLSPTINISATTDKNIDEDKLAEMVIRKMGDELRRLV